MSADPREEYIGDGVYALYNGFDLRLRAPREGGDHVIYLEREGFITLQQIAARYWPELRLKNNNDD